MKHVAALALALCVAIGVVGAADKKYVVGVSMPSATHGWMANANWWANKAKTDWAQWDPNVTIELKFSGNASTQSADIEDLMLKKVDALVVFPHDISVANLVEKAFDSGIYTVVLDRGVGREGIYDIYLSGDDHEYARKAMTWLCEQLGGQGDIVLIAGSPTPIDTIRTNAAREAAKKYPGIKILDVQPGDWNKQKAMNVMENYLQKYKKIDAVYTADDDMMLGALQAYKESGRKDIKHFFGGACLKEVMKMIMDGTEPLVQANCTYPPAAVASGISYAVLGVQGKKLNDHIYQIRAMPSRVVIPAELVTKENAKDFYFADTPF